MLSLKQYYNFANATIHGQSGLRQRNKLSASCLSPAANCEDDAANDYEHCTTNK